VKEGIREVVLPYLARPAGVATLDSGHTVVVIPKPGDVVHLHTVVRVGSALEDDETNGISHFLEHLMFKGTPRYPAGDFDRILEGMGARINASTSKDWTQYYATLPKGEEGRFYRRALELHADMLLNPLLPENEIGPPFDPANPEVEQKRERHVVIEEIKMGKDNPWRRCLQALNSLMYRHHPYKREVIGTEEVIARVSRETLMGYYRRWYAPDNMVTIVAGDLEIEPTVEEVRQEFQFGDQRVGGLPVFPPEPEQTEMRVEELYGDVQTGYVLAGFRGAQDSLEETIALDIAMVVLGEGKSSRLHQRLIETLADSPFFDLGAAQWEYRDETSLVTYGVCRADSVARSVDLLKEQIAGLASDPPTVSEFEKARTRLEARFAAEAEWAMALTLRVADSMVRRGDLSAYIDYLPTLQSLTPADVSAAIQRYIQTNRLCLVTMSPGSDR